MPSITPNLWFDTEALEAAEFYTSVFPNSEITNVSHYTEAGPREAGMVLTVDFSLDGQRYTAINGGPEFPFNEAMSLLVELQGPGRGRRLLGRSSAPAASSARAAGSRTATASRGRSSPSAWRTS